MLFGWVYKTELTSHWLVTINVLIIKNPNVALLQELSESRNMNPVAIRYKVVPGGRSHELIEDKDDNIRRLLGSYI